jgi:predicted component of type VI protein secretion system
MASARRTAKYSVIKRLQAEPFRFSFVQAVRLLEHRGRLQSTPRRPIGSNALPPQECVHLAALASLSFPASEVIELQEPAAENEALATDDAISPPKLTVGFMGYLAPVASCHIMTRSESSMRAIRKIPNGTS